MMAVQNELASSYDPAAFYIPTILCGSITIPELSGRPDDETEKRSWRSLSPDRRIIMRTKIDEIADGIC